MNFSVYGWLFAFTILAAGCGSSQRRNPQPLAPGRLFKGEVLNIKSPNSPGWEMSSSSPGAMEFFRRGAQHPDSHGAQVLAFAPPASVGKDAFLNYVKEGAARDTPAARFDVIRQQFRHVESRKYPCVGVEYQFTDKKALTSMGTTEPPFMEGVSLYCLHPVRKDIAFAVIFSHRGLSPDPDLKAEAEGFFHGVQVPGY